MKKTFLLLLLGTSLAVQAQTNRYIVYFKDKAKPAAAQQLLTEKALLRRAAHAVQTDWYDYPVNAAYLRQLPEGAKVMAVSKWLNAAMVESKEPVQVQHSMLKVEEVHATKRSEKMSSPVNLYKADTFDFGGNAQLASVYNVNCLHQGGYTGQGISVAFLDAGYLNMDTLGFFKHLRDSNRISYTYDFWRDTSYVYTTATHGTLVSGFMLARTPGKFVGLAPDISELMLFTTDDFYTETKQDEFYYVRALEMADSLGADVISVSLSYKDFDIGPPYSLPQLDGKTAISTIGVNVAASKGIILVNGAGNNGTICAPCDAKDILCVGGAWANGAYDNISSYGPTGDGRIKPDVAGITRNIAGVSPNGSVTISAYGGTSSATPQVASVAVLLKQANPGKTNLQIMDAIRRSGRSVQWPDNQVGNGIPDACKADSILKNYVGLKEEVPEHKVSLYPNPVTDVCRIHIDDAKMKALRLFTINGTLVQEFTDLQANDFMLHTGNLPAGVYISELTLNDGSRVSKRLLK